MSTFLVLAKQTFFGDTYDMQYAQVLINSKTDELKRYFSYKIPPKLLAYIKIGSVVKIPFGRRTVSGVVAKITRRVDPKIKNKLKNIISLEYKIPIISLENLYIANMMTDYYLACLGQVVFFMTPKLSKRILSTIESNDNRLQGKSIQSFKSYVICNTKEERIKSYVKLVKKAFLKNKSAVILFADFKASNHYIQILKKEFKDSVCIFAPNMSTQTFTKQWIASSKKPSLIIGTRNSIFYSQTDCALIIIDEPHHFGYKEEQTIHHHILKVSQFYAEMRNANLILGDNDPGIANINIKRLKSSANFIRSKHITVLDNSTSKNTLLSYSVERQIESYIKTRKKLLILSNQKGASSGLICSDCTEIFRCPRCEKVLYKKHTKSLEIICPTCNYMIEIPKKCPSCSGKNIRDFGFNTERIKDEIVSKYGSKHILSMSESGEFKTRKNKFIYIGTNYALSWKELRFDGVVILDWENWSSMQSGYNYYQNMIRSFADICEISKKNIYIQTVDPENTDLQDLINLSFNKLSCKNLKLSKQFKYPPYYQLIKIYLNLTDNKKAYNMLSKLRKSLILLLKNIDISEIISSGKTRDKYHQHILLKIPIKNSWKAKQILKINYKKLGLSRFMIDVDPIKIL